MMMVGGICGYGCEFFQNIVTGSIDSGNDFSDYLYDGGLVGYDVNFYLDTLCWDRNI